MHHEPSTVRRGQGIGSLGCFRAGGGFHIRKLANLLVHAMLPALVAACAAPVYQIDHRYEPGVGA